MPNLTALLAEYGMGARDGIVIENDQNRFLSGYPYYLLPNIKSHDVTQPLVDSGSYVLAPLAHAITVLDEMPENVSVDALLATSARRLFQNRCLQRRIHCSGGRGPDGNVQRGGCGAEQ